MFVGGLDWDTTDDSLKEHFSKYGPVASCSVMRDVATGQSRGFAFLSMVNAEDVDKVLEAGEHVVDGKKIDPKRAVSRSDAAAAAASSPGAGDGAGGGSAAPSTEKIFVGGISSNVDRDEFKAFFEQFGAVADATLMVDRQTGRPRGFGFITFEDAQAVDRALDTNPADLMIKDKQVEIKRATPKSASSSASQRMRQPPNTRYAGAAARFGAGQPQYPYAAMAAAAASYYGGGGAPRHMQQDDMDDHQDRRSYSRDHHHRSSRHRDGSRDDRYRDDRSGGGAVHASSSSRNQSSYRPY
ncbi:hypothetical protein BCR42DRAFT_101472 [Absidia repens]|uniref:RRM domain-containing protein n=1 Tax=Absidia repens TaxID=90262 RepID=A0A1X2I8H4_9FUNG|nr:hypothetical protein BCR42DRAFT_101472 [Absidia repens]